MFDMSGTLDNTLSGTMTQPQEQDLSPTQGFISTGGGKKYDAKRRKAIMEMLAQGEDPGFVRFNHVMHGFDEDEVNDAIETFTRVKTGQVKPAEDVDPMVDSWATAIANKQATLQQAQEQGISPNEIIKKLSTKMNPEDQAAKTKEKDSATSGLSVVNDILDEDKYKAISGPLGGPFAIPFTEGWQTKAKFDQLKGMLSLDKRQMLKGQGQISDFEFKVLGQAATDLNRMTSEKDFKTALKKVKGVYETSLGGNASVKVKSLDGEVRYGVLSREEIDDAIKQGYFVEYN